MMNNMVLHCSVSSLKLTFRRTSNILVSGVEKDDDDDDDGVEQFTDALIYLFCTLRVDMLERKYRRR